MRRAVESYKRHARGERAIAFTPSVGSAMELAERLRQAGVRAVHVEANTPDEVREGYFEQLRRGKLEVLCNCDVSIHSYCHQIPTQPPNPSPTLKLDPNPEPYPYPGPELRPTPTLRCSLRVSTSPQ